MFTSFSVLILRAAVDLHNSLNNSSGQTNYIFFYEFLLVDDTEDSMTNGVERDR